MNYFVWESFYFEICFIQSNLIICLTITLSLLFVSSLWWVSFDPCGGVSIYSLIKFPSAIMSTLSAIWKPMLYIVFCLRGNSVTVSPPSANHKYHNSHTTTDRHKTHIKYSAPKWLYIEPFNIAYLCVHSKSTSRSSLIPISITLKRETIRRYCELWLYGYLRLRIRGYGFVCAGGILWYLLLCIIGYVCWNFVVNLGRVDIDGLLKLIQANTFAFFSDFVTLTLFYFVYKIIINSEEVYKHNMACFHFEYQ